MAVASTGVIYNVADVCLFFEEHKIILKWYFKFENVSEVQKQWSHVFGTQTHLTILQTPDKFKTHSTVWDVHKGKSSRPRKATSAFAIVLK